jgi:hypothetical protein
LNSKDAATFAIMTFDIMALSLVTLRIAIIETLSITTINIIDFIATLGMTVLNTMGIICYSEHKQQQHTLNCDSQHNDSQHNSTQHLRY